MFGKFMERLFAALITIRQKRDAHWLSTSFCANSSFAFFVFPLTLIPIFPLTDLPVVSARHSNRTSSPFTIAFAVPTLILSRQETS